MYKPVVKRVNGKVGVLETREGTPFLKNFLIEFSDNNNINNNKKKKKKMNMKIAAGLVAIVSVGLFYLKQATLPSVMPTPPGYPLPLNSVFTMYMTPG